MQVRAIAAENAVLRSLLRCLAPRSNGAVSGASRIDMLTALEQRLSAPLNGGGSEAGGLRLPSGGEASHCTSLIWVPFQIYSYCSTSQIH